LAAGLVAMAVVGSYSGCDPSCGKKSPDVIAAGQLPTQPFVATVDGRP
jgi:hypothetical protein